MKNNMMGAKHYHFSKLDAHGGEWLYLWKIKFQLKTSAADFLEISVIYLPQKLQILQRI